MDIVNVYSGTMEYEFKCLDSRVLLRFLEIINPDYVLGFEEFEQRHIRLL